MSKARPLISALRPSQPQPSPQPPTDTTITTTITKSFNATINRLSSQGAHHQVLLAYSSMLNTSTPPDAHTFPSLLKACTFENLFSHGLSFHQSAIVNGYSSDAYVGSSLINFYMKFGRISTARKMFDEMPERNVVPWTAIIGCYSREGDINAAFSMYNEMRSQGIQPTSVTLLSLLPGVSELTLVQCLHSSVILYGFDSDVTLSNSIMNTYGKCGRIEDARDLFEVMNKRDIVSWNSLISGYSQNGDIKEILQLLRRMKNEGTEPDKQTFASAVSASAMKSDSKLGKLVHCLILKAGLEVDHQVETSLIVLYLRCGNTDVAFTIFERTIEKDVVLWTAMMSGLLQNDCADKALKVFDEMVRSRVKPSTATIGSALAACAQLGSYDIGSSIHGFILRQGIKLDIPAQNSLLTMYAKCGHLVQGFLVFDSMATRDLVSWNAIVSGYAKNGFLRYALLFFNEMRVNLQRPDSITVISLLQACASTGVLHQGKWVHNFVIRSCLRPCIMVDTALVDMYSKCGDLNTAQKCFDRMSQRDVVSWSTIIAGYGCHGKGVSSLRIFSEFLDSGIRPNDVIFLSILSACSHSGLIDDGLSIYQTMTEQFGISPNLEHRACIVDLLSRAGKVEEAYNFYKRMFKEAAVDVLGILLDACRSSGNVEVGEVIAKDLLTLRPVDAGNYVQLAHTYASMRRWDGVGEAWSQMRSLGLKKLPGWSSIELHGTLVTFFSDHNSHPQVENIMSILGSINSVIRKSVIDDETSQSQMDDHSRLGLLA